MNLQPRVDENLPGVTIDLLIARHGFWKIARMLAGALVRRNRAARAPHVQTLPNRLRRDIGLGPVPESRKYWDVRY